MNEIVEEFNSKVILNEPYPNQEPNVLKNQIEDVSHNQEK